MAKSSLRADDVKQSDIVSQFLDKYFYCNTTNFERVIDKERQVKGIDVIFDLNSKHYVCDEKAAIRYRNLQTFCLELTFKNKNDEFMNGWLIDNHKINDSFLFIWIDKTKTDTIRDINDILSAEVALVQKSKILEWLADYGWTVDKLKIKAKRLLENYNEPKGDIYTSGYKFSVSQHLVECPVNILMSRKHLIMISDISKKINL